ncbi:ABC transporter permease subunit [Aestuariicella hydrocarbonica]|uniref:ABC transporter permease subunit n=1 Tax=Pseudomaricurvus hydrocarbonicus TaxID=1470433 RepID=A0A9E5T1Q0_9GAMM|nr:ABC transporter permease [Aestuariicella hydrocarbonica]NHO67695.1 ABC transporter permease subunit [Aestuariicella hydrocarbonica]
MDVLAEAFRLIITLDEDLFEILWLSIRVSLIALVISVTLSLPLGTYLAITQFPGRKFCILLLNALMGMPPVVVGLMVYMLLSRSGPLGFLGLLYTPSAMIIAQVVLITPIITALAIQVIENLHQEYRDTFCSMGVTGRRAVAAYLVDARYALTTCILAGFGRAIAEVGAVIIVGGNIDHLTRVMTTAIALETSKGNLTLALSLGTVLLALSLLVNALVIGVREYAGKRQYA